MNFGPWIRQVREEKGLDLRTLGESAHLNASTISRIENETLNPVLETVVRLTTALGLTPFDFYQALTGKPKSIVSPLERGENSVESGILTVEDVVIFSEFFDRYPDVRRNFISQCLNRIYLARASEQILEEQFKPEETDRIFSGLSFYSVKLKYPPLLPEGVILKICQQGGAIISGDVVTYLVERFDDITYRKKL